MSPYIYIYMSVYIPTYVFVHICMHLYKHISMPLHIDYMHLKIHTIHIQYHILYKYTYDHACAFIYICKCVYVYICMCINTHIHKYMCKYMYMHDGTTLKVIWGYVHITRYMYIFIPTRVCI